MPINTRVLVVDDAGPEATARRHLLATAGHETLHASSLDDALASLARDGAPPHVLLLDLSVVSLAGLSRVLAAAPGARAVLLVPRDRLAEGREALRLGASDVVRPDDDVDHILFAVERAAREGALWGELAALRARTGERASTALVGRSAAMVTVRDLVGRAAASRMTVLVTGEPGTGKHLVARLVHDLSERAGRPYLNVRCDSADPAAVEAELFGMVDAAGRRVRAGLFEEARGGTLVLDELESLPAPVRARIARVLAEGVSRAGAVAVPLDVRLILVSSRTAEVAVRTPATNGDVGAFPVLTIALPALRERRGDVPLLVQHFRARAMRDLGVALPPLATEALLSLVGRGWPGNVRELEHFVERLGLDGQGGIQASPGAPAAGAEQAMTLADVERRHILRVVAEERGIQSRAAERLGIDRRTLYRKLRQYRAEGSLPDALPLRAAM